MAKRRSYRRERGQATIEIAIASVAIVFLVVGFFTLGGVGIFSIKNLLSTRFASEMQAEQSSFGNISESRQLIGWEYTTVVQHKTSGDKQIVIPFLARDEARTVRSDLGSGYLQEDYPSLSLQPGRAETPEDADYLWQNFEPLVTQRIWSTNTTHLASLHRQTPVLPDGSNESIYLFRNLPDAANFKKNLRDGGWLDIQSIDVTQWESSEVAFPAFAPQK